MFSKYWYDRYEDACALKEKGSMFSLRTDFNLWLFSVAQLQKPEEFVTFKQQLVLDFAQNHPPVPALDGFKSTVFTPQMCSVLSDYCVKYCAYKNAHAFFCQFLRNGVTRTAYAQKPATLRLSPHVTPPKTVVMPGDTHIFKLVRTTNVSVVPRIFRKALYQAPSAYFDVCGENFRVCASNEVPEATDYCLLYINPNNYKRQTYNLVTLCNFVDMPIRHSGELLVSLWSFIDSAAAQAVRSYYASPVVQLLKSIARNFLREIQLLKSTLTAIEFDIQIPVLFNMYYKCVRTKFFPPSVTRLLNKINCSYTMPQNFTSACAKILAAVCACDLVSIYRLEHWWHIENSGLYWNKRFLFFLPVNFSQEWSEFLRNAIDLKISGSKEPVAESARKFLGVSVANAEAWERLFDYIERRILANNALSLTNMYNTIGLYTVCHSDGVCVKGPLPRALRSIDAFEWRFEVSETAIPDIVPANDVVSRGIIAPSAAISFDDYMDTIIYEYTLKDSALPLDLFFYCEKFI